MRARSLVATIAVVFCFGVSLGTAQAGPKQEIASKIKEAMENYDLMDYDAARKSLTQALAIAKKAKLEKDPVVAKAHLSLGIVQFANSDTDGAKLSFLSAIQIDPKIQIDAAYKSKELGALLEQVRKEAGAGGKSEPEPEPVPAVDSVDCGGVQGMQHTIIDTAKAGGALPIEAYVGADVKGVTRVSVLYRAEGATDFTEGKLKKEGDCKYTGSIPSSAMKGSLVHYYVAAYADGPKPVASKGSSGSPNIIEVTGVAAAGSGAGDNEDPINGGGGGGGGSVSSGITVSGPKRARILIAIAGGGGTGYVSGETEGMNTVKNCCFGGPIVVLQPEIGYFVKPQLSISVAGRIGLPIGANVEGHATAAPGGVARVRYALSPSGRPMRPAMPIESLSLT